MSTTPYPVTQVIPTTYPLIMYARLKGLSTADLTAYHLRQFLRWSWKLEPIRNGLCIVPQQYGHRIRGRYWKKKSTRPPPPKKESTSCKS